MEGVGQAGECPFLGQSGHVDQKMISSTLRPGGCLLSPIPVIRQQ
jgi:hypothetical protein